jgi:glycosyltransferase involved in cell wall biosynthesis
MSPRRILIITFSYAPMLNARAFRWTTLARHLARTGWEVDVLTSWQPGAEPEAGERLQIRRVGWRWAEHLRKMLRQQRGQLAAGAPASSGTLARALQGVRQAVWRHVYWPDASAPWYWPARRAAIDLVRERRHDTVVSVSPTFTAVLVGQAALQEHPRAKWVIDIGDPFSLQLHAAPNNRHLYGSLNRRVERLALQRADWVSVTTTQTAQRYAREFPETAPKLRVIPPLLSIPAAEGGASASADDGTVRLIYIGTLYRSLREPHFMLQLFDALRQRTPDRRYELHLFGDTHEFSALLRQWRERVGPALHVHGMAARDTVARAVEGAHLLINIGNSSSDQLPSKVVEYAASGKPILNLARSEGDSSALFLASYPDKLTMFDNGNPPSAADVDALASFTMRLPRRLAPDEVASWLAPYRLPAVAARYEELLS